MAAQVNVNRKVNDPFYRYKMPRIIGKVEGRGNGIKTVLSNVIDVARALNVPPDYPTKYLGIELGAQVILDTKNDKFIINGAHVDRKLQSLVYDFIERYLICSVCQNPETELSVAKDRIKQSCCACGHATVISAPHRFNTYIIKHPPKNTTGPESNARSRNENESFGAGFESSLSSLTTKNGKTPANVEQSFQDDNGENVDWSVDVTESAVKQRMLELTNKAAELIFHEDLEKSIPERLKIFSSTVTKILKPYLVNFDDCNDINTDSDENSEKEIKIEIKNGHKSGSVSKSGDTKNNSSSNNNSKITTDNSNSTENFAEKSLKPSEDFDEILHEAKRLDIQDEAIIIVSEIIFDCDKILERIKQFCNLISKLVKSPKAEQNFISAIELVVTQHSDAIVPIISKVFFALYQLELVQEDTFIQWSQKKSKRYLDTPKLTDAVHKSASSFINWLKTAEEESSDGSDVIEFEDESKANEKSSSKWQPTATVGDDDDDLNIDDI